MFFLFMCVTAGKRAAVAPWVGADLDTAPGADYALFIAADLHPTNSTRLGAVENAEKGQRAPTPCPGFTHRTPRKLRRGAPRPA